jgi:predicted metal-dependent phosphoesterase TrpH
MATPNFRSGGGPDVTVRVDTHVKVLDERVVARAKARGLDAVVYAPHFTRLPHVEARAERFSDDDLLVVPAREVFTGSWRNRRHLLAVGLTEPVPDFITLEGALEEFARQGAAVLVPHPTLLNVSLDGEAVAAHREHLHAVETYNAKSLRRHNERAREIAGECDLPGVGSSYAHLRGTVGEAWTAFERPIDTAADLVEGLRSGAPRTVERRTGLGSRLRGAAEFAHLGYENTWRKLDRLFLSGMEPTHPRHVAYDGGFDDVAVY